MSTSLYVASIPYNAREINLIELFEEVGEVVYARIVRDRETKLSRGFGFVEMANEAEAQEALKLNGTTFGKSKIIVKPALDKRVNKNKHQEEVQA